METSSVAAVFRALNDAGVRYVVVGGLAVLAHGILRATNDIDIVLGLEEENVARATEALSALGFRPLVPVPLADLGRAERRRAWIEEKGAKVFHLFSDRHRTARVDIFLEEPFDLTDILERALREEVAPGVVVPFIGLDDLVAMKLEAGHRTSSTRRSSDGLRGRVATESTSARIDNGCEFSAVPAGTTGKA